MPKIENPTKVCTSCFSITARTLEGHAFCSHCEKARNA